MTTEQYLAKLIEAAKGGLHRLDRLDDAGEQQPPENGPPEHSPAYETLEAAVKAAEKHLAKKGRSK